MRGLLLGLTLLAGPAHAGAAFYALVVGNNEPPQGATALPPLHYADDDAARYFQFFRRLTDQVRVLTVLDADSQRRHPQVAAQARPPTSVEVKSAIAEFAARIRADVVRGDEPVVYITFSGHGAVDEAGSSFFALEDGKLTQQQLYDEVLAPLEPAYVHLFVDACHAEGVVGSRGTFGREVDVATAPVGLAEARLAFETRLPARFSRVGAMMATTSDQQAHEWSRIESGVFTHELLSGLSGAADVNGDGVIEYSELQAFIASANRDIQDPRAIPKVVALAPRVNAHAPVLRLSSLKNTGFLAGRFSLGHFYVELESGERLLDAHLAPEHSSTLAMPPGRVFLIASSGEVELQVRAGETTRAETLKLAARSEAARGSLEASLRRALFQSPFGPTYYKGYIDSRGEVAVIFSPPPGVETAAGLDPRKASAVTALGLSGALLITSAVSTGVAVNARGEYDRTRLQRAAFEAQSRANGFAAAAVITGGSALALAVLGWWLWPAEAEATVSVSAGADGAGVVVGARW